MNEITQQEYDDALREWQDKHPDNRCQWSVGDEVMYRYDSPFDSYRGVINAIDIPTRRVRIITSSGGQVWVYMEHVWRSGNEG